MSIFSHFDGQFLIAWEQAQINGSHKFRAREFWPGATFRWSGESTRIDGPDAVLRLVGRIDIPDLGARIRQRTSRVIPLPTTSTRSDLAVDTPDPTNMYLRITDGQDVWRLDIVERDTRIWLAVEGSLPPTDVDLHVLEAVVFDPAPVRSAVKTSLMCFTDSTKILTHSGYRPICDIKRGDYIQTRDNGLQELMWTTRRHMSQARMMLTPETNPIRFQGGARVSGAACMSPDHNMLLDGAEILDLFGESEVLVAAAELTDGVNVRQIAPENEYCYRHLVLPQHEVIFANGVPTESLHPATADLQCTAEERPVLEAIFPGILENPASYGPFARRVLSAADAEILRVCVGKAA